MSDELKPCPFCGSAMEIVRNPYETGSHVWTPSCTNYECGLEGGYYATEKDAIRANNTRPVEDALRAELNRVAVFLAVHGVEGYTIEPKEAAE